MIKLRTGWMGGLALLAVLLVGGAGCEKKQDGDKAKTEATGSGSASDAAAAATGSGSGTAAGSGAAAGTAGSGAAAPATGTAVATGGAESPVIAELHALRDTACACKDAACAEGVQKSFEGFIQKHANTKPGPGDEQLAEQYAQAMMECMMKAMAGSEPPAADPGAATTPPATAGSSGLPACDEYIAAVEKFATCDKVPKETRDQTKAGIDQMKSAWGQMAGMPEDARKSTNDACKQGLDAMRSGAKALGCDL